MATNWLGILSSAVGLGASVLGGNKQQKQLLAMQRRQMQIAENYLNAQNRMWQPYVDAGRNALAQTRAFVNEQNAERFAGDRLADIARDRSVAAAYQTTARNNANIAASFGNNTGRVVGSQMRNERAGNEAISNANFNWAQQVRSKQTQATNNYLQGLTSLNNAGYTGTNAMSQAYNNYASMAGQANAMGASVDRGSGWQDVGGILMGIGANSLLGQYGKQAAPEDQANKWPTPETNWGDYGAPKALPAPPGGVYNTGIYGGFYPGDNPYAPGGRFLPNKWNQLNPIAQYYLGP